MSESIKPTVFISYCQQPAAVKDWVARLGGLLEKEGFDPKIDTEDNTQGQAIPDWIREAAKNSDFVLLICTPEYQAKDKQGKGYLWDELQITQARWKNRGREHGVFPLVRSHNGRAEEVVPAFIKDRDIVHWDFTLDAQFESQFTKLVETLKAMTQRRYQQQSVNPEGRFAKSGYGIILTTDVVNFTHRLWGEQEKIMERLLSFEKKALSPDADESRTAVPLLDGMAIIWKDQSCFDEACEAAKKLIDYMEQGDPSATVRVGLHIGSYSVSKDTPHIYFGSALNDCRRICQVGDHKHIIISERFFKRWLSRDTSHQQFTLYPPAGEKPIEVYPWREDDGKIRLLRRDTDRVPVELYVRQVAAQWLRGLIEYIGKSVGKVVEKNYGIPPDKQNLRVTLWSPNPVRPNELIATEFRWPSNGAAGGPASQTVYHLINGGEPPAGWAYGHPEDVFVVHRLPDPKRQRAKYVEALVKLGARRETITKFSRLSRTFLCFAFPAPSDDEHAPMEGRAITQPFGVVCIDLEPSLQQANTEDLKVLTTEIRKAFQSELILAWRDRV